MIKKIMVLGLSLCAAATVFPAQATDQGARQDTHQIILRLKDDGVRRVQAARVNEAVPGISLPDGAPLTFVRPFDGNGMVMRLPQAVSLQEAQAIAAQLVASGAVASAQADKRMYPTLVPNDPRYIPGAVDSGQWHLFEDTGGIRMQGAWDRETGSAASVIAQLDTGFLPHRDIDPNGNRVLPGYDFFSGGLSNLGTELDNDPVLGDPVGRDSNPTDPGDATVANECEPGTLSENSSWHGLSVASVMVAESDNALDIAGIDFATRLLPIRVLGKCGGAVSDVADAIRWAAGFTIDGVPNPNPARVLNLSLSGDGACTPEEQAAINDAVSVGAVVVVSAGNEGVDVATQSPANCQNVLTVGATLRDGSRAPYTNNGEEVILSAPGGLTTTAPNDGILVLSNSGTTLAGSDIAGRVAGSSFSTAQVSAVASLMLAVNSSLTEYQVREILRRTTRAFPDTSCSTSSCGSGILDADAALAGAADPASVLGISASTGGGGCTFTAATAPRFDPLFLLLLAFVARRCRQGRVRAPAAPRR
ncbi:MAG: S8 family serine peptidase [Thiogranum sp.]